jgi:MYXO-CTERM domain-containing protein
MKKIFAILLGAIAIAAAGHAEAQTPALNQFLGKNGLDTGRNGSGTGANGINFTLEPTAWPHGVTNGSLIVMSGAWPDAPTTANSYPADCVSPCAPTWTDNGTGNTWTAVFSPGSCMDSNGIDHGTYYSANYAPVASGTVVITETHPTKIANSYFSPSDWYNIATSSPTDGSSCATGVTPTNNAAPNISGTPFTTTADGDLIYVEIDDAQVGSVNYGSPYTSITVPSGCTLLESNGYMGHSEMYCIQAAAGRFVPQFTIAQSTHSTFTVTAVAFKAGSGGSGPAEGAAVLLSAQGMTGGGATFTQNVACPASTRTLVMTDDASGITALSDSNGDTFVSVSSGGGAPTTWYKTGIGISSPNTFTVTYTTNGNGVDLLSFYCLNTTELDTGFMAGAGNTQVSSSSVFNGIATGGGGADETYVNLPTGTPGSGSDLFVINGTAGIGPFLTCSQPVDCVSDFPMPSAANDCSVAGPGVCGGDADDYSNGDSAGHFWQSSPSQITWAWTVQNNSSADSVMVTAFKGPVTSPADGGPPDSGQADSGCACEDAGSVAPDAGSPNDAGPVPDAGPPALSPDAGPGCCGQSDGGVGGNGVGAGCGCAASGDSFWALGILALAWSRRLRAPQPRAS